MTSTGIQEFGESAKRLARNPLGIIALFILLVYGFAAIVTVSAGTLESFERLPLIYFLVAFPFVVLFVFAWMVSKHSDKLYGPSDFSDENNFMRLRTAALLGAASAKDQDPKPDADMNKIADSVRAVSPARPERGRKRRYRILWVDDRPENNHYEREAFEAMGLQFTIALSTDEAFEKLARNQYAAIISDMGRREGPREGYVLLDRLREEGNKTPIFIYASSNAPEHIRETFAHKGQGCTNNPQELFEMVTGAVFGT